MDKPFSIIPRVWSTIFKTSPLVHQTTRYTFANMQYKWQFNTDVGQFNEASEMRLDVANDT